MVKREEKPKREREKTTSELQKEYNEKIRRDKARKAAENKENENKDNKSKKNNKKTKQKQQTNKQQPTKQKQSAQQQQSAVSKEQKKEQKAKKKAVIDAKMVKKFNKDCLRENKAIEINATTEKFIMCGLSQKDNVLRRYEDNYEKIANMLCLVLLDKKNLRSKKPITLQKVYDIIFNQTNLRKETESEFIALCLEIMSVIENMRSPLYLCSDLMAGDILSQYLCQMPQIESEEVMTEFDEYGLQYAYPLRDEIIKEIEAKIAGNISLEELCNYLSELKENSKIYGNYKSIRMIIAYMFNSFYFDKCNTDEQKDEEAEKENEQLAKSLILSKGKGNEKTAFTKIIELLHHKDEEAEDEDDDEDEVVSHSMLIISNIISVSAERENSNCGLQMILKTMESARLISYNAIQKFVQCDNDKYTVNRLNALSKLTDWIANLDARQARIMMERDNEEDEEEEDEMDDGYAGNLLAPRMHKSAADYETVSYVDVE